MRSKIIMISVLVLAGVINTNTTQTFYAPPGNDPRQPNDLWDLDHYYFYVWDIELDIPQGQTVVSANLSIDNINNWIVEDEDVLYMSMLANDDITAAVDDGVISPWFNVYMGHDGQSQKGNELDGYGMTIDVFTDDNEVSQQENPSENYTYTFTNAQLDVLNSLIIDDGGFGLGFDPDCHYYNDGIYLTIVTSDQVDVARTPEPGAITLTGLGIGLVSWLKRRKI